MKYFLLTISLFLNVLIFGQEPSYFVLGEDALEGSDIYDIIQDQNNYYWIATDRGLFKHDGYSYEKVESEAMKASSLFNLKIDSKGTIYCYNFSHQVFKIKEGKLELFYEIPKQYRSHEYSITLDKNDNLIILTNVILTISETGQLKSVYDQEHIDVNFNRINNLGSGTAFTFNDRKQYYLIQTGDTFKKHEVQYVGDGPTHGQHFKWVQHENELYAIDWISFHVYRFDPNKNKLVYLKTLQSDLKGEYIRAYSIGDQIWIAGQTRGIRAFDKAFNPLYDGRMLYEDHFVSVVFTDHEGNHLLGTFDEGILVIPNLNTLSVNDAADLNITTLCSGPDTHIYCGTSNGDIYSFSDQHKLTSVFKANKQKVTETLRYWKQRNALLSDSRVGFKLIEADGTTTSFIWGAFKDATFVDENTAYLGFNNGITRLEFTDGVPKLTNFTSGERIYSIQFEKKTGLIYAGSSEGLKIISQDGSTEKVELDGSTVYANELLEYQNSILAGTKRNGLLFFKNGVLTKRLDIKGQIIKVIPSEDYLFINSREGFFIYKSDGTFVQTINRSSGLRNTKIVDFTLLNNTLIIANLSGIQTIDLKHLYRSPDKLPVKLQWLKVNGKETQDSHFSYDQRKIEFKFAVSTLRNRDNVHYLVKLQGYDEEWRALPYAENSILYNALPPGTYTLIVRSNDGGTLSEPLSYSFTISAPFYLQWWFYLIITLLGIFGVILFYRQRMKIQAKKARQQQELNMSKLTAIQSQMNPHFIFNSLNSIQDLVIRGDAENSYTYITKFANLVRKTLNYSDKDFIEFEQEIQLLELYLTLEKLRFKESFDYTLDTGDISDILIPPMLIQPFIENALVHGLLHKENHRLLKINFRLNEHLQCIIEDNGIGRERAKQIKERQGASHESFAVKGIKQRFNILKETFGDNIGFYYEDVLKEGNVEGTRVIVYIPVKRIL